MGARLPVLHHPIRRHQAVRVRFWTAVLDLAVFLTLRSEAFYRWAWLRRERAKGDVEEWREDLLQ